MVYKQTAAVLLTIWALVAMPALCASGVLEHACECDEASCCEDEASHCSDPCDMLVAGPGGRGDDDGVPSLVADGTFLSGNAGDLPLESRACVPHVPPPQNLPYPPSDRPLLI